MPGKLMESKYEKAKEGSEWIKQATKQREGGGRSAEECWGDEKDTRENGKNGNGLGWVSKREMLNKGPDITFSIIYQFGYSFINMSSPSFINSGSSSCSVYQLSFVFFNSQ